MNNLKIKIISLIILTLILISFSCKTSTVTEPVTPPPDSKTYTWKVDTIALPNGYFMNLLRMWASSATDVWAVGNATTTRHMIWRFDGVKWKTDSVYRDIDPFGVWGSSKNDVWIGNTDGSFWHYDGANLTKFCDTKIDNWGSFIVQDICGSSATDIYAVGYAENSTTFDCKAAVMHFNGIKWESVNIPYINNTFTQIRYNSSIGEYLILNCFFGKPDCRVYSFNGKEITQVFEDKKAGGLSNIGDKLYFSDLSKKIYRYEDSKFTEFLSLEETNYFCGGWGKNENDFFVITQDGIGHYDGTDIITTWKKPDIYFMSYYDLYIDGDFFSIWRGARLDTAYIVHGVLKK